MQSSTEQRLPLEIKNINPSSEFYTLYKLVADVYNNSYGILDEDDCITYKGRCSQLFIKDIYSNIELKKTCSIFSNYGKDVKSLANISIQGVKLKIDMGETFVCEYNLFDILHTLYSFSEIPCETRAIENFNTNEVTHSAYLILTDNINKYIFNINIFGYDKVNDYLKHPIDNEIMCGVSEKDNSGFYDIIIDFYIETNTMKNILNNLPCEDKMILNMKGIIPDNWIGEVK